MFCLLFFIQPAKNFRIKKPTAKVKIWDLINYLAVCCPIRSGTMVGKNQIEIRYDFLNQFQYWNWNWNLLKIGFSVLLSPTWMDGALIGFSFFIPAPSQVDFFCMPFFSPDLSFFCNCIFSSPPTPYFFFLCFWNFSHPPTHYPAPHCPTPTYSPIYLN